jgi:hypothetical protein
MNVETEILEKVKEIMNIHTGGELFFDKLDGELIGKASPTIFNALFNMVPDGFTIVLSGGFGKKVVEGIKNGEFPVFPYILFEGGIRSGNKPTLIEENGSRENLIFLDDSIYGGATYEALKTILVNLKTCAVIYDGCPIVKPEIKSLFRYYDHFNSTPKFKF